jgi:putative membrane protein
VVTLADRLALDRTNLSNERTLLAYVRTALALAATGVALPKLVGSHPVLDVVQWTLVGLGLATAVIGLRRFFVARRQISGESIEGR